VRIDQHSNRLWLAAAGVSVLLVGMLVQLPGPLPVVQTNALRMQVDPETGDLVPVKITTDNAEKRQLFDRVSRSSAGLQETLEADGGVRLDLQGRFQSLSLATIDSSGQLRTGCVTSERELKSFFEATRSPDRQE